MGFTITMLIVIALIIDAYLALKMVDAVADKGYDRQKVESFFLCFLFPIIGHLCVIALPDKTVQEQNDEILDLLSKLVKEQNENDI